MPLQIGSLCPVQVRVTMLKNVLELRVFVIQKIQFGWIQFESSPCFELKYSCILSMSVVNFGLGMKIQVVLLQQNTNKLVRFRDGHTRVKL